MQIGIIMVKSKKQLKLRLPSLRGTKKEMQDAVEKIASLRQFYHFVELKGTQTTEIHQHPQPTWDKIHPLLPSDISKMKCLDVGCNSGFYSLILAHNGADVLGIDINQTDIDVVAQAKWLESEFKTGAKFKHIDVLELDSKHHNKYDIIMFLGVYHHLPDTDSALQKLNKLLKKDGMLFFGSATNRFGKSEYYAEDSADFANDPHSFRVATPEDIIEDLVENGFELVQEIPIDSSVYYGLCKKIKTTRKSTTRFTPETIAEMAEVQKKAKAAEEKKSKKTSKKSKK